MQQQIEQIKTRVQQCIAQAEAVFKITMPQVRIRFDLRGRAAGMAGYERRGGVPQFYLRFNVQHMQMSGKTWDHLLNDTVPHEVAHTVCQAFPQFGRGHDAGWKRVCIALGGNGRTRYSEEDAPEAVAAQRPWVYITTTGHQVRITKVIHNKIQRQHASYSIRGGRGSINRECQFNWMTAPAQRAAAKPVFVQQPAAQPAAQQRQQGSSKAEQIRAWLRTGHTDAQIIGLAVTTLGMTAGLVKTYIKNNRSKI